MAFVPLPAVDTRTNKKRKGGGSVNVFFRGEREGRGRFLAAAVLLPTQFESRFQPVRASLF